MIIDAQSGLIEVFDLFGGLRIAVGCSPLATPMSRLGEYKLASSVRYRTTLLKPGEKYRRINI